MHAVNEHLAHHRWHMLGCGGAGMILVTGIVLGIPALAVVGAVACGAMCVSMIRTMFTAGRSH